MNTLFVLNNLLLGVGLAMDAFSVSMANGLAEPRMSRRKQCLIAGTYGGFQFLMPLIGWICVHSIARVFGRFERFIPWIALILLLWIGGKMLVESLRGGGEQAAARLTLRALLMQGIATSIDALSVGFTISDYGWAMALLAAAIIAAVTFCICAGGVEIGRRFGTRLANRAGILGGVILILIGVEIFVRGVFF